MADLEPNAPPAPPKNTAPSPPPTIGRIVHYVLRQGRSAGESRAATIVRVWDSGVVNLQVHLDGSNDAGAEGTNEVTPAPRMIHIDDHGSTSSYMPLTAWVTSAHYDPGDPPAKDGGAVSYPPGTWHYPPRV